MRRMLSSAILCSFFFLRQSADLPGNTTPGASKQIEPSSAIYDPDPDHPWNRVHRALFVRKGPDGREHGVDDLEPLLWPESKHLVTEPSRSRAIEALDAFLSGHAERKIKDPLKAALFQRDLWAVFDWLAARSPGENTSDLSRRIARVMRRVALPPDRIRTLPDNYEAAVRSGAFPANPQRGIVTVAFLPAELWSSDGAWVLLEDQEAGYPLALSHAHALDGRSALFVFLRLPGGRMETLRYLETLRKFSNPWVEDSGGPRFRREIPQFPMGTAVALVRRMLLIDDRARISPTRMTENVQLRVYRSLADTRSPGDFANSQAVSEFVLSRRKLFSGNAGGLRPLDPDEKEFPRLFTHGEDPLESSHASGEGRPALERCGGCHGQPGIYSVNSYTRIASGPGTIFAVHPRRPPRRLTPGDPGRDRLHAVSWKQGRASWRLLSAPFRDAP